MIMPAKTEPDDILDAWTNADTDFIFALLQETAEISGGAIHACRRTIDGARWHDFEPLDGRPSSIDEVQCLAVLLEKIPGCDPDTLLAVNFAAPFTHHQIRQVQGPPADFEVARHVFWRDMALAPRMVPADFVSKLASRAPLAANDNSPSWPGLVPSGDFVRGFVAPDYHIDGVAQAGFLYSVTAQTGTGKTAILLLVAALTAIGEDLGDREIRPGRVIYFAGENPDDVRMRWIAQAHAMGFDPETVDVVFVPGVFNIKALFASVAAAIEKLGGCELVVVDTSAAYFNGDDENANVAMGKHARDLRALTTVAGGPCVLVACHPTKGADNGALLPRGGGAFIAEVDGNLTCAKQDDGTVKLHWQGKHRGPDFEPIMFELKTVTAPSLVDSRGRDIPTVMAQAMTKGDARARAAAADDDLADVLLLIDLDDLVSLAAIADELGWANRRRAQTVRTKLIAKKLIKERALGRGFVITDAGRAALAEIKAARAKAHAAKALANGLLAGAAK